VAEIACGKAQERSGEDGAMTKEKRGLNLPMRFQHDDLMLDELLNITPRYVEAHTALGPRRMSRAKRTKYVRQTTFSWLAEHGYVEDGKHSPWIWSDAREAFVVHAILAEEEIDNLNAHRNLRKKQFAKQIAKYEKWAASPKGIATAADIAAGYAYVYRSVEKPKIDLPAEPEPARTHSQQKRSLKKFLRKLEKET
jgi:hypothetical protein